VGLSSVAPDLLCDHEELTPPLWALPHYEGMACFACNSHSRHKGAPSDQAGRRRTSLSPEGTRDMGTAGVIAHAGLLERGGRTAGQRAGGVLSLGLD
jgi:hypothetical protein